MPELCDVEGFRRYLTRFAAGRRIESVAVADPPLLRNATPQALGRAIAGERLARPGRHGKWLIAPAGEAELLFHFGMTGRLVWSADERGRHRHDRLVLRLHGGELRYRNMRRFGGVWLARSAGERRELLAPLGPDAMAVDRESLREILADRRRGMKSALMDQELIAGLGNLLSDEILWRARIDPRRRADELTPRRVGRLHEAMVEVLRVGNRRGRVPPERSWLTGARDRRDARCPRCGTRLRRATIAGRTTVWCPRCQRG